MKFRVRSRFRYKGLWNIRRIKYDDMSCNIPDESVMSTLWVTY